MRKLFIRIICFFAKSYFDKQTREVNAIKLKFKYFKPVIKTGIFGDKLEWQIRDKPLTEQEIKDWQV